MNYSNYRFTLDIQSVQSQVSLPVKFGDTARSLYITITDGGVPYVLKDGCRAVFSAIKGDGNHLLNNCIIENNAVIRYDFTDQTATASGIMQCEIILYGSNGKVIGAPRFVMVVDERIVYDDDIISQSERTAIDEALIYETKRQEAENGYTNEVSGEFINGRIQNEAERKSNEVARAKAETARVDAETARANAEIAREEAEFLRENTLGQLSDSIEDTKQYVDETAAKCITKLNSPTPHIHYVYGEYDGETELIKTSHTTAGDAIVKRDADGYILVKSPTQASHPISKKHFDKAENHPLYGNVNELNRRMENLEGASNGKLYDNITLELTSSILQTENALPYGILSRIGVGHRWIGDNVIEIGEEEIDAPQAIWLREPFVVIPTHIEDSDAVLKLRLNYIDDENYACTDTWDVPQDSLFTVTEWDVTCGLWWWTGKHKALIIYGNIREENVSATRIVSGLPYTFDGAKLYNTSISPEITQNGILIPKGTDQGVYIPCNISAGATVTVFVDPMTNSTEKNPNAFFRVAPGYDKSTYVELGTPLTLSQDCKSLLILKYQLAQRFTEDVELKSIRIIIDDPSKASVMTEMECIEIPEEIIALEGYGLRLNDECYNYLDLTGKQFVRMCKDEGDGVVGLDESEVVDVSEYLSDGFDVLPLVPYCIIRFEGENGEPVSVPYLFSYKKKI